jgi:DNA-binding NarL/FixJ family response regulator
VRDGVGDRAVLCGRRPEGGETNKDIAVQLDLVEGTVKNHTTSILGKLGVADRTQAALRARELGIR